MPIKCCERGRSDTQYQPHLNPYPSHHTQQTSKVLRPLGQSSGRCLRVWLDVTITCRILFFSYQKTVLRYARRKTKMRLCIFPNQERSAKWRSTARRHTVVLTRAITLSGRQTDIYYRDHGFWARPRATASLNYALNHSGRAPIAENQKSVISFAT